MVRGRNEFPLVSSSSLFYFGVSFLHLYSFIPFYTSTLMPPLPVSDSFLLFSTFMLVSLIPVPIFSSSFPTFTLMSPILQHFSFLHFSTFTLVSPILHLFSYIFSFLSWWQLHAAATCLSSLPSLRTSHFPHHALYNNASTCCLAFFMDWLTFDDGPDEWS